MHIALAIIMIFIICPLCWIIDRIRFNKKYDKFSYFYPEYIPKRTKQKIVWKDKNSINEEEEKLKEKIKSLSIDEEVFKMCKEYLDFAAVDFVKVGDIISVDNCFKGVIQKPYFLKDDSGDYTKEFKRDKCYKIVNVGNYIDENGCLKTDCFWKRTVDDLPQHIYYRKHKQGIRSRVEYVKIINDLNHTVIVPIRFLLRQSDGILFDKWLIKKEKDSRYMLSKINEKIKSNPESKYDLREWIFSVDQFDSHPKILSEYVDMYWYSKQKGTAYLRVFIISTPIY